MKHVQGTFITMHSFVHNKAIQNTNSQHNTNNKSYVTQRVNKKSKSHFQCQWIYTQKESLRVRVRSVCWWHHGSAWGYTGKRDALNSLTTLWIIHVLL